MEEQQVFHKNLDDLKVKLIKGQKASWGWEITVQGKRTSYPYIIAEVRRIDDEMRRLYPTQEGQKGGE